jgi:hypothetical protein
VEVKLLKEYKRSWQIPVKKLLKIDYPNICKLLTGAAVRVARFNWSEGDAAKFAHGAEAQLG